MHRRLAKEISRIENRYPNPLSEDTIFEVLRDFKYIVPQGGPMTGIGNEFQIASLSNCFVIGNEGPSDSYGGVMKIDQEQVQLMKRLGGVGHDLSQYSSEGVTCEKFCIDFYRYGSVYGSGILESYPGSCSGRSAWGFDAECVDQSS